ncbi:DUF559 domain-containing protein [Paenibacillus rhizophilus]|uniref:DUF559 domain-containing protein n=1 Tax=Paenibacillus rhizophilus TaxID=1850366 RepID=UPI0026D6F523
MNVEEAHAAFIEYHLQSRTGERKGRLKRGHRDAEKLFCRSIWWPLQGNFNNLHPEYEVLDWRGLSYFCDFAWLTPFAKLIIEIKGFGPHVTDMDRKKYCNELNRETFLTAMGFQVISFAYDDVAHHPERTITLLRMVLSRYQSETSPVNLNSVAEREIIRPCLYARPPPSPHRCGDSFKHQPSHSRSNAANTLRERMVYCCNRSGGQTYSAVRAAARRDEPNHAENLKLYIFYRRWNVH